MKAISPQLWQHSVNIKAVVTPLWKEEAQKQLNRSVMLKRILLLA
ncbi:MAG: hypothetical protein AAGN15_24000 [Cyanobacteria bacterium J06581_3]